MEDLPGPPDLTNRRITIVEYNESVFRTHSIHRNPIFYGDTRQNRFDAPDSSFKVLYAARDPFCAFIETFARSAGTQIVTTTALEQRGLCEMRAVRPLRLVDLTQSGTLVRIGADARLFSGKHDVPQMWSKALHDHSTAPDGLLYPSRLDPARHAIALFSDRAPKMSELHRHTWYATGPHRRLLAQVLDHYGLALIENTFVPSKKPATPARQNRLFET